MLYRELMLVPLCPTATYWENPLITACRFAEVPLVRVAQAVVPLALVSTVPPLPVTSTWLGAALMANRLALEPEAWPTQVAPPSVLVAGCHHCLLQ